MENAPFYDELAEGPTGGAAYWARASDGVRIRVAVWPDAAAKGTVLLFPGRTEYAEKYGRAAGDLAARGYATLAVDWRGQGLADRVTDNPMTGHVSDFSDYQKDVMAALAAARALQLPEPFFLIGHSMGGCIGLRALYEGLPVKAAAFSAPMWGIGLNGFMRPVAWSLSWSGALLGVGHLFAPGTKPESYVLAEPFEGNKLTKDPDMFDYMVRQTKAVERFGLGGPSLKWLYEALVECARLIQKPAPDLPCVSYLGTDERIVDTDRVALRMADWDRGELVMIEQAEHEIMMEVPRTRAAFFDGVTALFDAQLGEVKQAV